MAATWAIPGSICLNGRGRRFRSGQRERRRRTGNGAGTAVFSTAAETGQGARSSPEWLCRRIRGSECTSDEFPVSWRSIRSGWRNPW